MRGNGIFKRISGENSPQVCQKESWAKDRRPEGAAGSSSICTVHKSEHLVCV